MTIAILIFLGVIAFAWAVLAISPAHAATFRQKLTSASSVPPPPDLPPVTLVIPARNEGSMLPTTVPTWCGQDYPGLRVVVVDDQSDDDTAGVLGRFASTCPGLSIVSAGPRPAGWLGKPWAVTQGVEGYSKVEARAQNDEEGSSSSSRDSWLLFSDADIAFHPSVVRLAMAYALSERLDMLSLVARMTCGSAIERIGMAGFVGAIGLVFPFAWANDPKRTNLAMASGGFILVKRAAYQAVGGHAALRSEMVEDMKLALRLKQHGFRVRTLLTDDLLTTRMYEGWDDLWEGLTKNAYAGMEYRPLTFLASLGAGFVAGVLPPVYLLVAAVWVVLHPHSASAWIALGLAFLINVLTAILHARAVRYLRLPWGYALTVSVSGALLTLIGLSSAWQHHFGGGNVWKGRRYDRATLLGTGSDSKNAM
jgi:cellulose synthase/poly-beta-1,6-N-acetylglucosamine synthase-like glycosyltransferase